MTLSVKLFPRYLSIRESGLKPGSLSYFVDISEKYRYILGKVVAADEIAATVVVEAVGVFSGPRQHPASLPVKRDERGKVRPLQIGDTFSIDVTEWVPHTPKQFEALQEKIQDAPPEDVPLSFRDDTPDAFEDMSVAEVKALSPEDRKKKLDEWDDQEDLQEDTSPEEGSPDFDAELDKTASVSTTSSLRTWSKDLIVWPEGYPLPWMEDVYDALPEGVSDQPGGQGITDTKDAPPAVISPGSGGLMPANFGAAEKAKRDMTSAGKEIRNALDSVHDLEVRLEKSPDESVSIREQIRKHNKDFEEASKRWQHAKERYVKYRLPGPADATYVSYPGKHQSREGATGRQMLRQNLEYLSDSYERTQKMYEEYQEALKDAEEAAQEVKLVLDIGQKKLIEETPGKYLFVRHRGDEKSSYAAAEKALEKIEHLKKSQFYRLPYVWDKDERKKYMGSISGIDPISIVPPEYRKYLGGSFSFNDLPFLFLKHRSTADEAEGKNPVISVSKNRARAASAAKEYVEHLRKHVEYKHPWKILRKYVYDKHKVNISIEDAKRLELLKDKPGTSKTIYFAEGTKMVPIEISSAEVKEALEGISTEFRNRVLWLKGIQDGLEKRAREIATKLKRESVEGDSTLEKEFRNMSVGLPSVVNTLSGFARKWRKSEQKQQLLGSTQYRDVVLAMAKFETFLNKLSNSESAEEVLDEKKLEEATSAVSAILKFLTSNKFEEATDSIEKLNKTFKLIYRTPPMGSEKYKEAIVDIFKKVAKDVDASKLVPSKYEILRGKEGPEGFKEKYKQAASLKKKADSLRENIKKIKEEIAMAYMPTHRAHSGVLLEMERAGRNDPETSLREYEQMTSIAKAKLGEVDSQIGHLQNQIAWLLGHSTENEKTQKYIDNSLPSLRQAVEERKRKKKDTFTDLFVGRKISPLAKKKIEDALASEEAVYEKCDQEAAKLKEKMDTLETELSSVKGKWQGLATEIELELGSFEKGEK